MARPIDLPPAEKFEHGTRSRYVCGCRCDDCKRSNRDAYRKRQTELVEAAKTVEPNEGPTQYLTFTRTKADGTKYEVRGKKCPGTGGKPCVKGGSWMRGQGRVCLPCAERATIWNGLVCAKRARRHLKKLSNAGVGYKAVSAACDIGATTLAEVIAGRVPKIRAQTEKKILEVDAGARADQSLISSKKTWGLIKEMMQVDGVTARWISEQLGYGHLLGILAQNTRKKRELCTALTASKIERLHRRVMSGELCRDAPLVLSNETYVILRKLLKDFTKRSLEKAIGYHILDKQPKRVRRSTAEKVKKFWENREPDQAANLVWVKQREHLSNVD